MDAFYMIEHKLSALFNKWAGVPVGEIAQISPSGSSRKYYRLKGASKACIGVYNEDVRENKAFLSFTRHFLKEGLNVPEIYAENTLENIYLLQDLGDKTLFSRVQQLNTGKGFAPELVDWYKKAIDALLIFQLVAGKGVDFNVCYPRAYFDEQSVLWDLNYFKYYFLRLSGVVIDEQELENDFHALALYLTDNVDYRYFLYRDFQSRNIIIHTNQLYFIDYQGGRRGALQYDLASLLYQAKADIPEDERENLLDYYIASASKITQIDKNQFTELYRGYTFIRMLQVLGAYGFRGIIEQKEHFVQSIPFALDNLKLFFKKYTLPVKIPALKKSLQEVIHSGFKIKEKNE